MLNLFGLQAKSAKNDVLSGLTVALALVPEAIAFAFVAGVNPLVGLYSAFFIGLLTAILGGRPGMISGATGAMAVVVISLVALHGIEYLFPTVILCGLLQIGIGVARLGKLIRMVPHPVMLGFVNGLAIVIGLAQLDSFKTLGADRALVFLSGTPLLVMVALTGLTMGIIAVLPKLTRAVPASLAAIAVVTVISLVINHGTTSQQTPLVSNVGEMLRMKSLAKNTRSHAAAEDGKATLGRTAVANHSGDGRGAETVLAAGADMERSRIDSQTLADGLDRRDSDVPVADVQVTSETGGEGLLEPVQPSEVTADISGDLPVLFFISHVMVPWNWETLQIIFPFAVVLCGVGLIESLMTMTLIDEITETRGQGNRECIGQGVANVVCGLFGGMGGCAMIGQSLINVNSGGRGRLSGITAALCLLLFILFLGPLIKQIPMAALVGVMFMVVIGTFEWASLKMFRRMPKSDVLVMVLVAGYTVLMHNLAMAVILGVVVSALVFAWQHATHMGADVKHNEFGSKIYQLHGPLFFASVSSFKELFDVNNDPSDVVIDFYYSRVYDQSGLEAINQLAEKYSGCGKRLHLTHLSPECRSLLDKAGDLVEINVSQDPQYHVASDRLA